MIIRFFYEGGQNFMLPIYLLWITALTLAVLFIGFYFLKKKPQKLKRINDSIIFLGSLAFLIGALGQMIGLIAMFDSIQIAGEVIPARIAGALKVTMIAPVFGLSLLILSAIIWFIFRNLLLSNKQ